jgi:hypothetical protein
VQPTKFKLVINAHMPSHAVGSLWRVYSVHELCGSSDGATSQHFFNTALRQTSNLKEAFLLARSLVHTLSLRGESSANCNRVAGFAAAGSSLDQRVREGAGCWPPGSSCVSPAPQLKREWSPWPEFDWFPANLRDFSKG